ncbi:uncharacterized protein LOC127122717 [Lathyrus oleraceus]|uniref:uncharacterized protein LOC127122717 n=1 Tax=Pisum sativum TaxID=3888 RepID=UPI0021D29307|nr:uncharacterized protein LOC127122717 [Pisum sativum]
MDCSEAQKLRFSMHMLVEESDEWWINTRQVLDVAAEVITWVVFRREFLRNYFLEDVRGKKEIEFLELKHGNLLIIESMFPNLWNLLSSTLITVGLLLSSRNVSNSRMDDSKAWSTHYKGLSERRGNQNLNCGKPYSAPADKGKQRAADSKRPSGGGALTPLKCYRCGELDHRVSECKSDVNKCYKCGKSGYLVADFKENVVT